MPEFSNAFLGHQRPALEMSPIFRAIKIEPLFRHQNLMNVEVSLTLASKLSIMGHQWKIIQTPKSLSLAPPPLP